MPRLPAAGENSKLTRERRTLTSPSQSERAVGLRLDQEEEHRGGFLQGQWTGSGAGAVTSPFQASLLRMWLSGLILLLTQRKHPPKERTLMLCDEIGNLGRLEALLTATTLLRSWG